MHLERADPICPRSALCGADRGSGQPLVERTRSMTTGRQRHLRFMRPQVLLIIHFLLLTNQQSDQAILIVICDQVRKVLQQITLANSFPIEGALVLAGDHLQLAENVG